MRRLLSHFLAFLLAIALALSVSSWILERTIWDAPYIERHADQANLYPSLAEALPKALAAANPEAAQSGLTAADPALIQNQVTTLLPQFIDHLHKAGPAPTIDLAALAAATGQPVPEGSTIKQLDFGSADARIVGLGQDLRTIGTYAPFAALALIVLIIGAMGRYRFPTLTRAALSTAIALGLAAGVCWIMPSLILQPLSKPTLMSIRDALEPFVTALCHSIAGQFGIAALVFVVVALGLWLVPGAARLKAKFTPKPKTPPQATPPTPGTNRS